MTRILLFTAGLGMLMLVAWASGRSLLRVIPGSAALGRDRSLATWVLGVCAWMTAGFVAAATGTFGTPVATALAVAALVSWLVLDVRRPLAAVADATTREDQLSWRWLGVHTIFFGAVVVPLFLLALGPQISWDADVYHLTLPRLMLETGHFAQQPFLVYGHWPQGVELLFGWAMLVGGASLAKLVHFAFGVATLWLAGRLARLLGAPPLAAWLAAALLLLHGVVLFEMRVAYVDLAQAFFFVSSLIFLERARQRDAAGDAALMLAGLSAGCLAGTKVTGFLGAAVLVAVYGPALLAGRGSGAHRGRRVVSRFLAPLACLAALWPLKAWVETGNPIYPFVFGGPGWSAEVGEQFAAWQRAIGMGRDPIDYLLLPFRLLGHSGPGYARFDGALSPVWLAVVPVALGAVRSPRGRRVLAVAGSMFVVWAAGSQQSRFLIPILPLIAAAAATTFAAALGGTSAGRAARPWLPAAVTAIATGSVILLTMTAHARTLVAGWQRISLYDQATSEALARLAEPEVFRAIDERLPEDARILFLNHNRGFFCRRDYLADSFFEASQIADWLHDVPDADALAQTLRSENIDHVLWGEPRWGIGWPPALLAFLADPARARPVYRDDRFTLFALSAHEGDER